MLGISNKMPMGLKGHLNVHSIATKMKENDMYIQMEDGRKLPFCDSMLIMHLYSLSAWWLDVLVLQANPTLPIAIVFVY